MEEGEYNSTRDNPIAESPAPAFRARAALVAVAKWLTEYLPQFILLVFALFLADWFKLYGKSGYIPSNDLPGHVAIVERLMPQLSHFRLCFYDPAWFSGWPAFQFYAFLPHLLTALFAFVLAPWCHEPVALASRLFLWLGCAALPFSYWYFALPLAREIAGAKKLPVLERVVLAVSVCFLSFWFFNYACQGLGGGGAVYTGLYSQLFAWHFMLLHGGAVTRLLQMPGKRRELLVIAFFALLFLTHTLTSLFVLAFVLLISVWYSQARLTLWRIHLIAIGLACFWFLPGFVLGRTYTVLDIVRPYGDFFEIFFRYPLAALIDHVKSCLSGSFVALDVGILEVDALFLLFLFFERMRRSKIAIAYFLVTLAIALLASSGFIASSIPATIHYYRFYGYAFVYLTPLLALVPLAITYTVSDAVKSPAIVRTVAALLLVLAMTAGIYSISCFPEKLKGQVETLTAVTEPGYTRQILNYFKSQPAKGRVFFESSCNAYHKFPFFSGRYLESRLFKETGFETLNGLFIQSSLTSRIASATAHMAKAVTWNCPLVFVDNADIDVATTVRQLRELGVTHVACGSDWPFLRNIERYSLKPVATFEPYVIVQIAQAPQPKVETPNKMLVGYVDRIGNLPFDFVEYYLIAHRKLNSDIDLIDLTDKPVPPEISTVLVNENFNEAFFKHAAGKTNTSNEPTRPLNKVPVWYQHASHIDHDNVWYSRNFEQDAYKDVEQFLDPCDLPGQFAQYTKPPESQPVKPELTWADDFQSIKLTNLMPERFLRVNYSYFPFWHSDKADLYRGSSERIFVLPHATEVTLTYDPWQSPYTWLGLAITLASILSLPGVWSWCCSRLRVIVWRNRTAGGGSGPQAVPAESDDARITAAKTEAAGDAKSSGESP